MTGFFLRAVGLATVLYFVFVMPIGRKTIAEAAMEVWQETHLRHALEVKFAQMHKELTGKMRTWQKTQANGGALQAADEAAMDGGADGLQTEPQGARSPPPSWPKRRRHSRGRLRGGKEHSAKSRSGDAQAADRFAQEEPAELPADDAAAP